MSEHTEVIGSIVDGLRSSPATLALVVLVGVVFTLTYWSVQKQQERSHVLIERLLDGCEVPRGGLNSRQ